MKFVLWLDPDVDDTDQLSIHMTGPVRPWRAGDERGGE